MIVIFDWDGTLCDSLDGIVRAMLSAALELDMQPPTAAAVRDIIGLGLPEAVAKIMPTLDQAGQGALATTYSEHYQAQNQGPALLFEGALDTLHQLRASGLELAVATGKSRRGLQRVLRGLGLDEFFDITRCADETRSKPHPQMLREILQARGRAPADAVMVGDTEYDLAMAKALDMPSVGVSYGVHSAERLHRQQPLAVIDRLPDLLPLLAQ